MADRAFGIGNIGFGTGIMTQGIRQAASPGVSPDTKSLAVINSNQLRRGNVTEEAKLTPKQALLADAKAAGVTGTGRMNVKQLTEALGKISKGGPLIAPVVAGSIAYGATPTDAQASTGDSVTGRDEALTNAGVAAGGTYGISKLLDALKNTGLGRALGGGMTMAMGAPQFATEAYNPPQEEKNRLRNVLAGNLPEWAQVGAIKDAADMSQVPEPSPMRPAPGNPNYPLSSGQIPMEAPQQAAAAPEQPQAAPQEFASLDDLAAAAEADPEMAALIRELVQARLAGDAQQAQLQ